MTENTETIYSTEDLRALLTKGDEYREIVIVDYLGKKFEAEIKPLNDLDIADIRRMFKNSKLMKKAADAMKKLGKTKEEDITDADKLQMATEIMDGEDASEVAYMEKKMQIEFCKRGIVDKDLATLVTKGGKWGITKIIGSQIQKISNVPPEAVKSFFDLPTAK